MKLAKIELTNFRCFEKARIEFSPDLTVLVGNNGSGKTAILDGIAYALSRVLTRLPQVKGKHLRPQDIRVVRDQILAPFARVEAEIIGGIRWAQTIKSDQTAQTAAIIPAGGGEKALYEFLDPTIHAIAQGQDAILPVFAYYGVSRAVLDIPERRRDFRKEFRRFDALDNALEATSRFKDLFEWFYAQELDDLRCEYLDPEPKERVSILSFVRRAVGRVVPGFTSLRIETNPLRMVVTQRVDDHTERELSLQMLSDGFRIMLALVMDFARRMAQANPHLPNPLEAEAILMVDEIDLHLHPIWQQTVIPSFQRAFPNTQLIVSTHSPQVLTTVESDKIYIVEPSGVRKCPAPTYGASSADVVAEVLGLPGLRPPDNPITNKITALFDAIDHSNLDRAKELRLELNGWAKGFPEPDLVRADLLINRLEFKANGKLGAKG